MRNVRVTKVIERDSESETWAGFLDCEVIGVKAGMIRITLSLKSFRYISYSEASPILPLHPPAFLYWAVQLGPHQC